MRICFLLVACLLLSSHAFAAEKPLNVLVLYADDWRWDTLGVAGNRIIKTPNLDALAGQGYRFANARVTTSVCWVGRACLYTGQWMSRHGSNDGKDEIKDWKQTYPMLLKAAGYHTGHIGKWHNGRFPEKDFDFARQYSGRHYVKRDGKDVHVTELNERDALEFLATRPKDKPFALTVAFFAVHAEDPNPKQYIYQPGSAHLYKDVTIPVPKTATPEHIKKLPPFIADEKNEGRKRWYWRFDTPERFQEYMKAYYRMATEVDATCGRILQQLKKEGQLDNTLVIFTTDNGYFHAEHGLADKWYPYEESTRVPLIVRDPRIPAAQRGKSYDKFVLNIDVAPTILAATGLKRPQRMQGSDLANIYLKGQPSPWADEFFYEHPTVTSRDRIPYSEALVRHDWKYILWPEWEHEELFDLTRDPYEENNLARSPEHASKLAELRARFADWKQRVK